MKICPKCRLEGNDNFCYQCGETMIESTEKSEPSDILSSTFSALNSQTSGALSSGAAYLTSLLNKSSDRVNSFNTFNGSRSNSSGENSNRNNSLSFSSSSSLTSTVALDTKPLSTSEYFKYNILFGIPMIGFIVSIMFGFGNTSNINVRNLAQATFYSQVLLFLSILILMLIIR